MLYVFGVVIAFLFGVILLLLVINYNERRQNMLLAEELIKAKGRNKFLEDESNKATNPHLQLVSKEESSNDFGEGNYHKQGQCTGLSNTQVREDDAFRPRQAH